MFSTICRNWREEFVGELRRKCWWWNAGSASSAGSAASDGSAESTLSAASVESDWTKVIVTKVKIIKIIAPCDDIYQ